MKTTVRGVRLWRSLSLVALGVILATSTTAVASHRFSDVATSASYHNAVDWIANRSITLGCATGLYCPNDFVTRGQMALLLNRLGIALTPTIITQTAANDTSLDLDANPVVCATDANYTPTFSQRAIVHAYVSVKPALAAMSFRAQPIVSTDSGSSWNPMSPGGSVEAMATNFLPGGHTSTAIAGFADLSPGTPYRFGIQLMRASGAGSGFPGIGDIAGTVCEVFVEAGNRNPTSSPFSLPQRRP